MKILKVCLFLLLVVNNLYAAVSTESLLGLIGKKDITILDTRSEDAYNGWILNGEKRRGHIHLAKPFPAQWIKSLTKDSVIVKKLISQKEVIVYGAKKEDTQKVYDFLKKQGVNVAIYESFLSEYVVDKSFKLDYLKNYKMLVPASYINDVITNKKSIKVFEVSWGDGKAYKKGHIPTAVHINTDLVEFGPIWNYKSKEELLSFALSYGISKSTPVILYGPDFMPASRVAIALMAMGVEDVRILNGGFNAWKDAGYLVQIGDVKAKSISDFGGKFFSKSFIIKDLHDAQKIIKNPNAQLVSIRSKDEWLGKTSGYSYIKPKGNIKGAVWGKAGSDAYHLEDYRSISGKMKNQDDIEKMWKDLGVDTLKHLSFYCGTGWRAAEVLFYAYVMGYENVSMYDGGWLEWSLDAKN
jgi:thiosulfate/3-mercaptopyruvate sulfurtransferase